MTVNYIEKGIWLHQEVARQGHKIWNVRGTWYSTNDVAVQAIIDSFDPIPDARRQKRQEIKAEAARRAAEIYEFIGLGGLQEDGVTTVDTAASFYNFAEDIYMSVLPTARGTLASRLAAFKAIKDAAQAAIITVNGLATFSAIQVYDAVNDPSWP